MQIALLYLRVSTAEKIMLARPAAWRHILLNGHYTFTYSTAEK
jgi:hypothetical protein